MRFNYFDFGLFRGTEMGWMVDNILPSLGIKNYHIYGFEACKHYADVLKKHYVSDDKVTIINKAIVDTPKKVKLYYADNAVGHSVFSTKRNVSENHEEVDGAVFSEWLEENVPDYKLAFNIIKVNIEGAEWFLFNDLVNSGVHKYIKIYCGQGHDVEKVEELKDKVKEYYQLLKDNNIHLHRFTEWKPHQNDDLREIIVKEAKKVIKNKKEKRGKNGI